MNTYELMLIYFPSMKEAEVKAAINDLKAKIKDLGGETKSEDYWGLKDLAYEMEKQTQGFYLVTTIDINSEKLKNLETWIKRQEGKVLRSMITNIND